MKLFASDEDSIAGFLKDLPVGYRSSVEQLANEFRKQPGKGTLSDFRMYLEENRYTRGYALRLLSDYENRPKMAN